MGFQRDTRQVEADNAEVVTAIVNLFAVLVFPHAEEAATAHWRFERTGDFDYLIVVQDVRIHTLARALQRQLFDVVVRIAKLVVQTVTNCEHQFREDRSFTVLPVPAMRLRRMDCWIKRDSQLVPRPKPKVTNGV